MSVLSDKELNQYRDLVKPPDTFEDAFGWKSFIGAVFIGLVMLPAAMFMSLSIGENIGPAAKWVTVLLFLEMAKRARSGLKNSEIFILFALVGTLINGPMQELFFRQFLVQSEAARSFGLTEAFPAWYAPTQAVVLDQRTFFAWEWLMPIALLFVSQAIQRLDSLILGYGLFRLTSDIEKLPFPLAPIGAAGVTALSENQAGTEGWRWRAFSVGAALGLLLMFVYAAVPVLSTAVGFAEPFRVFPIPWLDTTSATERFMPATATGINFDPTHFFLGMALPFFGVLGAFIGVIITCIANPMLYQIGWLPSWQPGMKTVQVLFSNTVDFYLSFGIGLSAAIALIGLWQCLETWRKRPAPMDVGAAAAQAVVFNSSGRGDIRTWVVVVTYVLSSIFYIALCGWLLDWDFKGSALFWVLIFFAFVYTPLISYVTARLEGIAGQAVDLPFVREAAFILSGYKGVEVWLLPVPIHNYGAHDTVQYRTAELVGCSFRSIWKLTAVSLPLIFVLSLLYGQFIWSLAPIPSPVYPYAQEMWELQAKNRCLIYSSTSAGYSPFLEALNPWVIGAGGFIGLLSYASLSAIGMPILLVYGVVKGLGQSIPQSLITEFAGALFGRYVLAPRLGEDRWRQYAPVVFAGFSCGGGLIMMFAAGAKFLSASVFQLTY
ncbi:hypothetical protein LBMAG53_26790 [Planctomycetota bacterium]|nr:hypothetical protein LBMAG53_26790 [Planctomycetota bacterium]